jgi:hypothetical protein
MSIRAFDTALAARQAADLATPLSDLGAFLDICRHALQRQAFPPRSLTWSASRAPLALSVLHKSETIWSVMEGDKPGRWLVSNNGIATRMTKTDALQHLSQTLAGAACMMDGVRFTWRKDDTIGGAF